MAQAGRLVRTIDTRATAAGGRTCALLLALVCVAFLTGCSQGPVPAAEFVTQAERLHAEALASTVNPDRDLNDYVAAIGQRIVQGAGEASGGKFKDPTFANMQFHLVSSPIPNAYTTGGRHIYIYNGLFQLCRTEEELAAVLAHQFAHAVDLDIQRTGMRPAPGDSVDRIAYLFVANPISPGFEQEADAKAFDFYARGGWDPAKYGDVYSRLQSARFESQPTPGRGEQNVPGIPLVSRASAANAKAREAGAPSARAWRKATVADPQTFNDLRGRATDTGGEKATPANRAWLYLRAFPNCVLPADLPAQKQAQEQLKKDITPVAPQRVIEPS